MKTIFKRTFLTITSVILLITASVAQKGVEDGSKYGHGEDSIRAILNLNLYKDNYKQKNYKAALPYWRVVFLEAPRASKNMYLHGNVMYKTLMQKTKDKALREKYIDTIMMIYDQRIKWFTKSAPYYKGRKGVDLFALSSKRTKEAYNCMNECIDEMGNNTPEFVFNEVMQASLKLLNDGEIEADAMVNDFSRAANVLEYQLKNAKKEKEKEKIQTVKDNVELLFTRSDAATCENLIPILEPKFNENPENIDELKNIVGLLRKLNCEDSELYAKSAENLYKLEPSANAAYSIAIVFLKKKNLDKAIEYYAEAAKLEEDSLTKSRYYGELSNVMLADGRSVIQVVQNANEAIKLNPKDGNPYITIGHAYASAKNIGENEFQNKTVFWAAVDMFYKAKQVDPTLTEKANELIATYSKYFPTKEEIFFNDFKVGASYTVPGWINRSTTVREKQ